MVYMKWFVAFHVAHVLVSMVCVCVCVILFQLNIVGGWVGVAGFGWAHKNPLGTFGKHLMTEDDTQWQ